MKLKGMVAPQIVPAEATRYQIEGLTPMRFRWDCLHSARQGEWINANLYPYANDAEIDTALRQIMREAGIKWASEK